MFQTVVSPAGFGLEFCRQLWLIEAIELIKPLKLLFVNYSVIFTLLSHQYPAVAHILTYSINLTVGIKKYSSLNVGLEFEISGSVWVNFKMSRVCNSVPM